MSSVRRKYMKKANNLGTSSNSMEIGGEEVISFKKETKSQKGGGAGGESSASGVTKIKKNEN